MLVLVHAVTTVDQDDLLSASAHGSQPLVLVDLPHLWYAHSLDMLLLVHIMTTINLDDLLPMFAL